MQVNGGDEETQGNAGQECRTDDNDLVNEQQMHQMIEHEGEFDFWCIWAVSEK
jgi:hypothetical protein